MRSLTARIFLLTLIAAMAARAAEPVVLPTISFYTLSKDHLTLPADFRSDRNLLLLYFDLTQERDINDWNAVIDGWRGGDTSLMSYTVLVSPQKNFLSRWWQNASMRSASPDHSHWPSTLPIYVDKHAFEQKLGISTEKEVLLLLTDRKGQVLGRVAGPPTDSSRTALRSALNAAGSPLGTIPASAVTTPSH
jgi:hypothetical protein